MKRNKDSLSYVKFIKVIDIIISSSDEKHPITVKEIQQKLELFKYDFQVDYRLIDKYVKYYNDCYDDSIIQSFKSGRNRYYYFAHTIIDVIESKAIIDLVDSSNFFTKTIKNNYKKRLQNLYSSRYYNLFNKVIDLHVNKKRNDQAFFIELENITYGINHKKFIKFNYCKPSLDESITRTHVMAPIDTCFMNNEYYLICQGNRDDNECIPFRIDYISNVEPLEDQSFEFNEYQIRDFNINLRNSTYMFNDGKDETVELIFDSLVYSNILDKFGSQIEPEKMSNHLYKVRVKTKVNSTFYAWIVGFGGKITISDNDIVQKRKFNEYIKRFI